MAYNQNQPPQYSQPNPYGQQQPGYQQPGYQPPPGQYPQQPMMQPAMPNPAIAQLGKSSIGDLDANIAGALSYFWIIGLIFFFVEKKNRFVRFHAFQAIAWGIAFFIIGIVLDYLPYVFFVGYLAHVAWVVGAVYAAVQAYNGKWFKLPVVGDMAEKNANSWTPMPDGMMGMNQPPMGAGYQQPGYPPQQPGYPPQPGTQYPQQPGQYPPPNQYPPQYPQQ